MPIAASRIYWDSELLTDATAALDGRGEVALGAGDPALEQSTGALPQHARSRVEALASRISPGVADYGLLPLSNLTAVARIDAADGCLPAVALEIYPTGLGEGQISSEVLGRLSQALRDPVSKLALFANLVAHGPADRQGYYEATLTIEIQSLAKLIDQLNQLAWLLGPDRGSPTGSRLDQLADVLSDRLQPTGEDRKPPRVTSDAADRVVWVDGRLLGEAIQYLVAALPHAADDAEGQHIHLRTDGEWLVLDLCAPAFRISVVSLVERLEPFSEGTIDLAPILARTILLRHGGFITVKEGLGGDNISLWFPSRPTTVQESWTDELS